MRLPNSILESVLTGRPPTVPLGLRSAGDGEELEKRSRFDSCFRSLARWETSRPRNEWRTSDDRPTTETTGSRDARRGGRARTHGIERPRARRSGRLLPDGTRDHRRRVPRERHDRRRRQSVSECETINYRATLTKAADSDEICAFSEGTFKLTLPNGTVVDINLDVPCIGGNGPGEGCDPTVDASPEPPHSVHGPDRLTSSNGFVVATAVYAGGVVHDNPDNTAGVGANTPKSTPVVLCTDNDNCTTDVCDPNVAGSAACSNTPIVCNDNNQCTTEQCDPATGCAIFSNVDTATTTTSARATLRPGDGLRVNAHGHLQRQQRLHERRLRSGDRRLRLHPDPGLQRQRCLHRRRLRSGVGCQSTPNGNPVCLGMNHFQCYEVKPAAFARRNASVEDRYVDGPVNLRSPNRLCAPVDKNDEDPTAPQDPDHLMSFPSSGSAPRVPNQIVTDQFGELHLDLIRRSHLLVPTAKALVDPPGPLANPVTDHFQCYVARRSSGALKFVRRNNVMTVDQFGSHAVDLLRPRYVCVPANKNDEDPGAPSHEGGLLCYKARHHVRFGEVRPFIDNQFVTEQVRLIRRIDFCVPATIED